MATWCVSTREGDIWLYAPHGEVTESSDLTFMDDTGQVARHFGPHDWQSVTSIDGALIIRPKRVRFRNPNYS